MTDGREVEHKMGNVVMHVVTSREEGKKLVHRGKDREVHKTARGGRERHPDGGPEVFGPGQKTARARHRAIIAAPGTRCSAR